VFDVRRCATTRRLSAALAIATGSIVCAQTTHMRQPPTSMHAAGSPLKAQATIPVEV
jgi:hypothetical protein